MQKEMKLAVLIDAENIASKYIEVILSEVNSLGNIIYKRIYGNWTTQQMSSWKDVILDYSIQPIQQYSNIAGKNASDSSLIIDAMDLLYLGRVDGFCIVSSDSDFTRLAARLRESEMFVMGMGEQKTPRSFINACNKFLYLDVLYSENGTAPAPEPPPVVTGKTAAKGKPANTAAVPAPQPAPKQSEQKAGANIKAIRNALKELTEENSDDDGWISAGKLGDLLTKRFPDFDVRNFGGKKFVSFIKSLGLFETKDIHSKDNETSKIIYFKLK